MTEGQQQALDELKQIETASEGAVEILKTVEKSGYIAVALSLYCGSGCIPRKPEGIPIRAREQFVILIPPDFPFVVPKVFTPHKRFAGYPHVQWGQYLCLYLDSNTEWDPNDGMFGYLNRLDEWIKHAAIDQLDPEGAPIHPPARYPNSDTLVVVHADTPQVRDSPWLGRVQLNKISDARVDIVDWLPISGDDTSESVGAAVLLSEPFPFFEYPKKIADLLTVLEQKGVPRERFLLLLQNTVAFIPEDSPLYVVIGAPMRGIRGYDESVRQHLNVWSLNPTVAKGLRLSLNKFSNNKKIQEIGEEVEKVILEWAEGAAIEWCKVYEERPEVTLRRDFDSSVSWFRNKTISIWGCGALGSRISEYIVRAGAKKVVLRDNDKVTPGVLVRQFFNDKEVGKFKSEALANKLKNIDPNLEIETSNKDILEEVLSTEHWTDDADLVIDTTASKAVLEKTELCWHQYQTEHIPVASVAIDHNAQSGLAVLSKSGYSGGPLDVLRRTKLELINYSDLKHYVDKYWPDSSQRKERIFQPEPGCSDATFIGSASDIGVLAGLMLNQLAEDLKGESNTEATAHVVTQPYKLVSDSDQNYKRFAWGPDRRISELNHKFEVKMSENAWDSIEKWIDKNARRNSRDVETGGLLFGEKDTAAKVIWVTEASGPPIDSRASEFGFLCGIYGTAEINEKIGKKTDGAAQFVGMWHTHPNSRPEPSLIDIFGMKDIVGNIKDSPREALLLIISDTVAGYDIGSYLYKKSDFMRNSLRPELPSRLALVYSSGHIFIAKALNGAQGIICNCYMSIKKKLDNLYDKYKRP